MKKHLPDPGKRLLSACPVDFRALVTYALLTGCRYGELSAFRLAGIDLTAGVVTVPRVKALKDAKRLVGRALMVWPTDELP